MKLPLYSVTSSQSHSAPGEAPQNPATKRVLYTPQALTPSVERVWFRILQQGYTVSETAADLKIRETTCESYLLKAMTSGKSYTWGPHMEVSDDTLQRVVDATRELDIKAKTSDSYTNNLTVDSIICRDCDIHNISITQAPGPGGRPVESTSSANVQDKRVFDNNDAIQPLNHRDIKLALAHLKNCCEHIEKEEDFENVIGVKNVRVWAIRRAKIYFQHYHYFQKHVGGSVAGVTSTST